MKKIMVSLSILLFVLGAFGIASAAFYDFTTIDYPGTNSTTLHDINNDGNIVGLYNAPGGYQSFMYDGVNFYPIVFPGAKNTHVSGINNNNHMTGHYYDGTDRFPFFYDGSDFTTLSLDGNCRPRGINDEDTIVGICPSFSFIYDENDFSEFSYGYAEDIDNDGNIVGYYPGPYGIVGFVYDGIERQTVMYPTYLSLATKNHVYGINNLGQMVGDYNVYPNAGMRGFVFTQNKFILIDYPGVSRTTVYGINDAGVIVGEYYDADGNRHGFLATPITDQEDTDYDGTVDNEESGPDGNDPTYDGNNDGIPDSQQDTVVSCHTHNKNYYVTIACSDPISGITVAGNPSSGDAPSEVTFPYDFFELTVDGVEVGSAITATLFIHDGSAVLDTYYKYGPTPNDPTDHWYEFLFDGQTGAEINGNIITLHFVDGLRGDADLLANGTIVDPGGPAMISTLGDGETGGGGGGGCFIDTAVHGFRKAK